MTLHQLKVFEAVARYLSLTKAADELHVTEPSVSQQVKFLEKEFEVQFYVRRGQGITLTREGEVFLRTVRQFLLLEQDLRRKFKNASKQSLDLRTVRSLTVGGSYSATAAFLNGVLALFSKTYTNIQVVLRTHDSQTIEQLLLKSNVEVALITKRIFSPEVTAELFKTEELLLVASVNHPVAGRKIKTLQELQEFPLVVRLEERIVEELEQFGVRPKIGTQCETPEALRAAVLAGTGVGILNRSYAYNDLKNGRMITLKVPGFRMSIDYFIVYPKHRLISSTAQDFLTLLRSKASMRHRSSALGTHVKSGPVKGGRSLG